MSDMIQNTGYRKTMENKLSEYCVPLMMDWLLLHLEDGGGSSM
jgi:hypothetical protein